MSSEWYKVSYHVWAVGRLPKVSASIIWNFGLSSAKPPVGSWEHPVVNWSSIANSSSVKFVTAVQNQSRTCMTLKKNISFVLLPKWIHQRTCRQNVLPTLLNDAPEPQATWLALKSAMLNVPVPHIKSCKWRKIFKSDFSSLPFFFFFFLPFQLKFNLVFRKTPQHYSSKLLVVIKRLINLWCCTRSAAEDADNDQYKIHYLIGFLQEKCPSNY